MKRMRCALALGFLLVAAAPALALDAGDRTFGPGRVGAIVKATPPADLAKIYGAGNVRYAKVPIGEGQEAPGAVIYGGSANELQVGFSEDGKLIEFIRIKSAGWKTKEGLGVGTTLAELERINGGPFQLAGFQWDYAGAVFPGPRSKLPKGIAITLAPTKTVSQRESMQVMGDRKISSRHPVVRKMGLRVESLVVTFTR